MAVGVQVVFDCADPERLAHFWASVLGYKLQDPPEGFASWEDWLKEAGIPEDQWNSASAIVDPDGKGPRVYFQRVPEGKSVKNRVHLDVNVGGGHGAPEDERRRRIAENVDRVIAEGASRVRTVDEPTGYCVVMQDPEGNEFCLQ